MQKTKAGRKEVARLAGVSVATVSYVLNNNETFNCTNQTRRNVRRAAKKLGYLPQFSASCLVKGTTNILGLLLPSQEEQFTSEYYSRIIKGLTLASDQSDYYLLYLGQNQPDKYRQCFHRNLLDGIFVLQSSPDNTHIKAVRKFGKPVITINYLDTAGGVSVTMDYESGMRQAVEHLVNCGCQRIGFITFDIQNQPIQRYRKSFQEQQKRLKNKMVMETVLLDMTIFDQGLLKIVAGGFDGLIIDEYWLYQKIEARYKEMNVHQPRSVVFCDQKISHQVTHDVLVLSTQPEKMGELAWHAMQKLLKNDAIPENEIIVPFIMP